MSEQISELDEAVALALSLSPLDKVRLVERVMATLESDLAKTEKARVGRCMAYGRM